jgi:hypothetical protein
MARRDAGRNDPCPCGSGEKYKKCCLGGETSEFSFSSAADLVKNLQHRSEDRPLESLDEIRELVQETAQQFNQTPRDDFQGLSPDQMHQFIYSPFDSPQVVDFPEELSQNPEAPVLVLFMLLAEAISEKGLKPTAKGNLPRNVCREVALRYLGEDGYKDLTFCGDIYTELDFPELNVVRIVCEQAGLIRKYRSRFILGRECREFLSQSRFDRIYTRLFRTYLDKFEWEYRDPYLKCPMIQDASLFSLYLLVRFGDKTRLRSFYEDCFLKAFPWVLEEIEPSTYPSPEIRLRTSYTERTLVDCFGFFGLVEVQPILTERSFGREYRLRKLPLMDQVVHFYLV